MKQNMGTIDRVIRVVLVVLISILYFTGTVAGTVALILGLVAVVFLLTGIFGICPAYLPFGLSTKK